MRWRLVLVVAFLAEHGAGAHPIPSNQHDRAIVVGIEAGDEPETVRVRVDYRLELDEDTARIDLAPYADEVDIAKAKRSPLAFYSEFARISAPILARHLAASVDGKPLDFICMRQSQTLRDEKEQPLGHLRCDFVFQAVVPAKRGEEHVLTFHEKNFADSKGIIHLRLQDGAGIGIVERIEPDEALRNRPLIERSVEDEKKLRLASARFVVGEGPGRPDVEQTSNLPGRSRTSSADDHAGLFQLFLGSEHGFILLLLISAGIGAVHALTPGHGKTLVAAYLVGQRGTIWHAVVLGLVTTLTHTGAVLALALVLRFASHDTLATVQSGLELVMGLLVACLGFWLLLQRLSGGADHIHIGAGHHHHGHSHKPEAQARNSEQPSLTHRAQTEVSWWGLIVLGMTGGIIPCWDAIAMLAFAIGRNQLALALPMLLAFSAGLAGVLVVLGILVVKMRNLAGSHWGEGRIVRSLPLVSALLVTAMGIWLCYESVHFKP